MKILGISTATKIVSVGLVEGSKVLADFTSASLKSEDLVVLIKRIMEEAGVGIDKIDGIAVAEGPGSYSGLRGGLAAAKSLAQVLDKPVVGVSTLEAMAYNLVNIKGTIAVICDAVRDEVNFALFTSGSIKLRRVTKDMVVSEKRISELLKTINGEIYIVGAQYLVPLINDLGPRVIIADDAHSMPSGVNAAFLGMGMIKEGRTADVLGMVPKYSHTPNIREHAAMKGIK